MVKAPLLLAFPIVSELGEVIGKSTPPLSVSVVEPVATTRRPSARASEQSTRTENSASGLMVFSDEWVSSALLEVPAVSINLENELLEMRTLVGHYREGIHQ